MDAITLDRINAADGDYLIFSKSDGVVSMHKTATEAIQAFKAHVTKENVEQAETAVYKFRNGAWQMF